MCVVYSMGCIVTLGMLCGGSVVFRFSVRIRKSRRAVCCASHGVHFGPFAGLFSRMCLQACCIAFRCD